MFTNQDETTVEKQSPKSIDRWLLFFFNLIRIHFTRVLESGRVLALSAYLYSERRDTCSDRAFHFVASFESQYLYVQVDVIMVAVVENCFPAVLLDVRVFLAWDASMHATIIFLLLVAVSSVHSGCTYIQRVDFFSVVERGRANEHDSMELWTFHPITKWARPIIGCGSTWKITEKKRKHWSQQYR